MALLGTRTSPIKEEPPEIQVDPKYIDYIEGFQSQILEASEGISRKREYILRANALGMTNIPALDTLESDVTKTNDRIRLAGVKLDRIKQMLALGYEPTSLNTDWYAGHLHSPRPSFNGNPAPETWPHKAFQETSLSRGAYVFRAPIPLSALERYAGVKGLVDDVRVYSPRKEDFAWVPEPVPHDPVLVGKIDILSNPQYFEIARWDIDADLAEVFGKTLKDDDSPKVDEQFQWPSMTDPFWGGWWQLHNTATTTAQQFDRMMEISRWNSNRENQWLNNKPLDWAFKVRHSANSR